MFEKTLISLYVLCFCYVTYAFAQPVKDFQLPDTICIQKGFLNNTYALKGKKANLSVLKWVMLDEPLAYREIQVADLSDKVSVFNYAVGGLMICSGFFVYDANRPLSYDLLQFGGYALGGGLLFQLISGHYEKRAVHKYNHVLQQNKNTQALSLQLKGEGVVLVWSF